MTAKLKDIPDPVWWLAAGLAAAAVVYWWGKGLARTAASAAVGAAGNVAAGAIEGVGQQVGVPVTNMNECQRALAEGRYWDASFACPAGTFISGVFGGAPAPAAPAQGGSASTNTADHIDRSGSKGDNR